MEITKFPAKGIEENLPTALRENPSADPRQATRRETMFQIIDTIRWSEEMQQQLASSGIPQLGNGVLAILDPLEIDASPVSAGASVRIHRPDGTLIERRVDAVEIRHRVVGLFFADLPDQEIPRLSRVELIRATGRFPSRSKMADDNSLARAISEEVHLEPHDTRWAGQFELERDRLLELQPGKFAAIEHIGSTAVPMLAAKPVIDLLAGVGSIGEADALLDSLCSHGYATSAEFNATFPDRRWLMRHDAGRRTHHLHLTVFGSDLWARWLQFRDLLRADPELAARYGHLKHELAARHHHDREAYTRAKSAFIDGVLGKPA